jgi:small subunit ribosomal protein S8
VASIAVVFAVDLEVTFAFSEFADFASENSLIEVNSLALLNIVNNMDPIADFLTIIRDAYLTKKESVSIPSSKVKHSLAKILSNHGYIGEVKVSGKAPQQKLEINLVYHKELPVLTHIKRISSPSVRVYRSVKNIPYSLSGKGLTIVSTSKGLLTDHEARKKSLGGEIICQVW